MDHPAELQNGEEVTVSMASKALKVGERGIYHAKVVLLQGTPEAIAAPQWEPRKPLAGTRAPPENRGSSGAIDGIVRGCDPIRTTRKFQP